MKARIETRFATARETADVLGVSKPRFRQLEKLAKSSESVRFKSANTFRSLDKRADSLTSGYRVHSPGKSNSAKSKGKVGTGKRRVGKKSHSSAKRHSRAKAAG